MTTQENYIAAETSWVEWSDQNRAFLSVPKQHAPPYSAVILGHERYDLAQHTLNLAAKFADPRTNPASNRFGC